MKQTLFVALMGATLAFTAAGRDYKVEDRSPVNHTFSNNKKIDVDVISGSVEIIGDGGNNIRVTGERIIHAADQQQLARAKQDDVLDMNEKDGTAQIYENGPFRNNNNNRSSDNHGFHENSDRQYNVDWNLTVHVPREIALHLRNVNGSIKAQDTNGAFDIKAVNGSVTGAGLAGSGSISTVNGPTVIAFRENPKSDSSFSSVNGKVDVSYQPNLSAEFDLKTVNGGMFTDFESVALASTGGASSSQNGKFVYKSHGNSRIRIGSGGPQIRMETVNGSIQIRKAK